MPPRAKKDPDAPKNVSGHETEPACDDVQITHAVSTCKGMQRTWAALQCNSTLLACCRLSEHATPVLLLPERIAGLQLS
jgi:hypothetical protein